MSLVRTFPAAGVLAGLVVATLGGCTASDETRRPTASVAPSASPSAIASTSAPPTSSAGQGPSPVAAYDAWLAALADRDAAAACSHHAPDFTIELRYAAILEDRAELGDPCTGFVALLWEDPARQLEPVSVEVTEQTAERARLAVTFPGTDESVVLVKRYEDWAILSTSPRTEAGDGRTARWVARWCDLEVGMTRAEVVAAMGPASGEYTVSDGGEPQLYWASRQHDFRAYLDLDDTVLDLVGDYDALSAADRAVLDCPELR